MKWMELEIERFKNGIWILRKAALMMDKIMIWKVLSIERENMYRKNDTSGRRNSMLVEFPDRYWNSNGKW